jgi:Phage major capsid protein E
MAVNDVFYPTGFTLTELTAAINEIPHVPSLLGDEGLFEYGGVSTLTVQIEKQGQSLSLVSSKARGSSGAPIGRNTRDLRSFVLPHLPLDDSILADEVQGVRLFGTESQPTPLQQKLMDVMTMGKRRFDLTMEFQRVGALKGIVLDADGTTTLYNFFTEFGVTQQTKTYTLSSATTEVRAVISQTIDLIEDELQGVGFTGMVAYCGRTFWENFITHAKVKEYYLNYTAAQQLQGDPRERFEFGGVTWVKYRGAASGSQMIAATEAYLVPKGVPGLLLGRFGPADYNETVNTMGLPLYAKALEKRNGKGWDVEMQSNPMHFVTRPRAVIKLVAA